jgi:hypothetical protein
MDLLPTILKLVPTIVNLMPNVKVSIGVMLMEIKTMLEIKFVRSITAAILPVHGKVLMVHINKSSVYQIQNSEKKLSLPNLKLLMDLTQLEQDSKPYTGKEPAPVAAPQPAAQPMDVETK